MGAQTAEKDGDVAAWGAEAEGRGQVDRRRGFGECGQLKGYR